MMKSNDTHLSNRDKQKTPVKGETTPEKSFTKASVFANLEEGLFIKGLAKLTEERSK